MKIRQICSIAIISALMAPVWAQPGSEQAVELLEEVIRSATVENFEELIALVPNMNFSGDGSRARYFQLRGIGELEQYEGAPNPSVGFIFDDIDLSGIGGSSSMFDVEQVEVLRGPQATRFGASALAGLVYIQSAPPAREFESHAELTAGNKNTLALGAAVSGPLSESLSGRLSVNQFSSDGFYNNLALGVDDTNQRDEFTVRGKIFWDINDIWSAKLSILALDYDNGYDAWSPENGRETFSDNPGKDTQETLAGSLKIEGALGAAVHFVSTTSLADTDVLFSFDGEWGDADYWHPYGYDYVYADNRSRESFSQEIRILSPEDRRVFNGTTSWVLGVYGQRLDESNDIISQGIYDDSADAPFSYCAPCIDSTRLMSAYDSSNLAAFGRLDSALSERVGLEAGIRFERWKADYQDIFVDEIYGDPDNPVRNDFSPDENLWGGDLALNFRISTRVNAYARISRGYKAGGFNPSLARVLDPSVGLGAGAIAYRPETLLNYEIGLKGSDVSGRFHGELSLFYMDRQNMQVRSSAQFTDNPNDFVFITSNGEGRSWGLEASATWQLTDHWMLHGAVGLLNSKIDRYALEREADIEGELIGRDFAHAPPYTLNLGLSYRMDQGWFARLDYNAAGAFFYDYSHDEKSSSYRTVNFRLGYQWRQWSVHGWVRNLFDESWFVRGFSFGLEPAFFPRTTYTRLADPRHYGATLRYEF
jgi:outer membrane receptor protein involved in Fe transport